MTKPPAIHRAPGPRGADAGRPPHGRRIDLIIVATSTPDMVFRPPPPAAAKLGVAGCAAFDVQAVCSGFVYALSVTRRDDPHRRRARALVVGAETFAHPSISGPRPACCLAMAPVP